jgi:ribosomal-protein-alanine N-acetyltransferase
MTAADNDLRLDPIGEPHLVLLSELHHQVFGKDGWSVQDWGALLAVPGAFGWLALAQESGAPVGFLLGRHAAGEAEILTLGVLPEARRLGAAKALTRTFLDELSRQNVEVAYLEVAESNNAAKSLYRNFGFCEVGRREGYYKRETQREDALIFRWRAGAGKARD